MKEIEKIVSLQKKIAPELVSLVEERYNILRHIRYHQPIGRRALAAQLAVGECGVRSGIKALREAGLIELSGLGMSVTEAGQTMVGELSSYIGVLSSLMDLRAYIERELGVARVEIVPGDSSRDGLVFAELGRVAACVLADFVRENMVVAVSGGSTMAAMAEAVDCQVAGVTVVPTRGGLGEQMERQANTIAATMAERLGGSYRLLHIPELLNDEAMEALKETDGSIAEIEKLIKRADVLLHGIGRADVMVKRRSHMPKVAENICKLSVGETLGHYFDLQGKCIYTYSTKGFRLNDLAGVGRKIAVAGGGNKAEAIIAVTRAGSKDVLVIDEAAASAIQSIINSEKSQKSF